MMFSMRTGPKSETAATPSIKRARALGMATGTTDTRPKVGKTTVFLARIV
jgi:hypothetical protein